MGLAVGSVMSRPLAGRRGPARCWLVLADAAAQRLDEIDGPTPAGPPHSGRGRPQARSSRSCCRECARRAGAARVPASGPGSRRNSPWHGAPHRDSAAWCRSGPCHKAQALSPARVLPARIVGGNVIGRIEEALVDLRTGHKAVDVDRVRARDLDRLQFVVLDEQILGFADLVAAGLLVSLDDFTGFLVNELLAQPVAGLAVDLAERDPLRRGARRMD